MNNLSKSFAPKALAHGMAVGLTLALAACGGPGPTFEPDSSSGRLAGQRAGHYKDTEAIQIAKDFPVHGVDVSKYQGNVDWMAVADGGVNFAYIKATEGGDRLDPKFFQNWNGAKAAGLPHGAYHFVYWCRPWQEEMAWFERNVPRESDALPPVLDVEATPTSSTCPRRLEKEPTLRDIKAMLVEMERYYGKKPIIYTTVDFYEAMFSEGEMSDYPMWIRSTKHHPAVKYGNRAWHFWQYQSDAWVRGIPTRVDRNAFYGDEKDWRNWLATNSFAASR
jgi:lysozyme